jgi:hypothetical protein
MRPCPTVVEHKQHRLRVIEVLSRKEATDVVYWVGINLSNVKHSSGSISNVLRRIVSRFSGVSVSIAEAEDGP